MVYAYVNDANGNVVSANNSTQVTFSVSGPGNRGRKSCYSGGGSCALVRTTRTAGTITVTASASGLTSGSASVTSQVMTDIIVPIPNSGSTPTPTIPVTPTPSATPTATASRL